MSKIETETVYISSGNVQHLADDFSPPENDDSYIKREAPLCDVCEMICEVDYEEPIATCKCHSMEWYL